MLCALGTCTFWIIKLISRLENSCAVLDTRPQRLLYLSLVATLYKQDSFMILFRTTIIFLLLTSCGDRIEREKLIGRYAWSDGRIDTLELRADGSYEYWTFAPGRKFANSGKWKLNPILNEVEFELENFPFLKNHVPDGSWFSRLRSRDNEVHLMYATDSDIYLKKIKPLGCVKN